MRDDLFRLYGDGEEGPVLIFETHDEDEARQVWQYGGWWLNTNGQPAPPDQVPDGVWHPATVFKHQVADGDTR